MITNAFSRYFQRLALISLISLFPFLLSACSTLNRMQEAVDFRSVNQVLAEYEEHKNPREVVNWLFRAGRKAPDKDALVKLDQWSEKERVLLIKLLDNLKGTKRKRFIAAYSEALVEANRADSFKQRFAHSDARTARLIIETLP